MGVMSAIEGGFCRSAPWRWLARRAVLPWTINDAALAGEVLELGGGSGAMAATVAQTIRGVRLTVTDLDPAMVSAARTRLEPFPRVRVETADATTLPYADSSFDVVTSYLMLHHVIDWRPALAEAARVLRPGGLFIGYDLCDTGIARIVHRLDGSPFRLLSPSQLREALAAAGFEEIVVEERFRSHLMRFQAVS